MALGNIGSNVGLPSKDLSPQLQRKPSNPETLNPETLPEIQTAKSRSPKAATYDLRLQASSSDSLELKGLGFRVSDVF